MRPFRLSVLLLPVFLSSLTAQITLNPEPTRVIGQLSTTVSSVNPNLVEGRELEAPESVVVDTSSNPSPLYIADTGNNRILGFRNAASFTNGQVADIVIGQPDLFTTFQEGPNGNSTRTTGTSVPEGMAVDASGNLYVIDAGNNRILRFPKPFAQASTVFPDLVIGQANFTTGGVNQGGLSASSLSFVVSSSALTAALAFDAAGNLWVTDAGNNRILRFNVSVLGAQPKSGPAADIVLGQVNFTTNTEGGNAPPLTSLNSIFEPAGIAFDPSGRLFVLEATGGRQGRVLVWYPGGSGFVTGQAATRMLGVFNGTPAPPPISQFQFGVAPGALFIAGNQIGVADTSNNRLLIFPPVEQWNTNNFYQAAATVVGQNDFNSGSINQNQQLAGPSTLAHPVGTYFFNSSLYVADASNNRMVVVPQNGAVYGPAVSVLGQPQLTLNTVNYIEGREVNFSFGDAGVAVDFSSAVPHLYVADAYNNRILGYYDLRNIKPGQYADIVIGQPDFLHSVSNYPNNQPSSNNLNVPTGLAVDSKGNLYVADSGNGRILRFPSPFANFTPGTPMAVTESADLLLGQISFTTRITDPTSQTMGAPYGLAFTSNGSLLASDLANNRVLFFPATGGTLTSGEAATIVFGQSSMTSAGPGSGLNQMSFPHHIAVDTDDRLYVADTNNHRVLIFNRAPTASNGSFAALTLTSGLSSPRGLDVNPATGDIWVADPGVNAAVRFPNFNNLIGTGKFDPNATLTDVVQPVALAEDNWGNLFVADLANRVAIFYPGLSVLNAANYWGLDTNPQFPMAPGVIAAMYSTGNTGQFGTTSVPAPAGILPLPQTLNGIQVLVNNTPAPLFYAGTDQINFEFPSSSPQSGLADVQVIETATGRVLGDTEVVMESAAPGIFTQNASGSGAGVIANKDGTLNTSANPATAGDFVTIYMTGQGYISGMPADGNVSNAALATPYTPLVYIVGGADPIPAANILYSGLAPTLVGVWQLNVKIPADVVSIPTIPVQVIVQVNSVISGGGGVGRPVYIYVKAPS